VLAGCGGEEGAVGAAASTRQATLVDRDGDGAPPTARAAPAACCARLSLLAARRAAARCGSSDRRGAHNPLDGTDGGAAALRALDATPGVVAVINGNGHRNRIAARRTARGGYWLIATSSLADSQQARGFRLRRAAGGYALETWMIDHDGAGLAGPARELAYLDAQAAPAGLRRHAPRPQRAAVRARAVMRGAVVAALLGTPSSPHMCRLSRLPPDEPHEAGAQRSPTSPRRARPRRPRRRGRRR
jgi:hypothetical protein